MTEAEQIMKRCQVGSRDYDEANNLHADCYRVIGKLLKTIEKMESQEPVAWVNKKRNTITWDKLYPDMDALYTHPKHTKVVFPTMLRKMWSGSEVQAWLDENVNKEQA